MHPVGRSYYIAISRPYVSVQNIKCQQLLFYFSQLKCLFFVILIDNLVLKKEDQDLLASPLLDPLLLDMDSKRIRKIYLERYLFHPDKTDFSSSLLCLE